MTTHAYSQLYLNKSSRAVGNMLHDAVLEFGMNGTDFLKRFIQSDVSVQIESGNPKYIAGKSGLELFLEVMEKTTGQIYTTDLIESYDRSDVYWVGWMLTHYQWYSGRTFKSILDTVPYDELIGLYGTLHEADIQKSYEVLDAHFSKSESKLKVARKHCGLTQEALANESGVSLNTIRAYERKSKDLNKAQFDIVMRLAKALKCDVSELL
ncbi:helix-turn-helix domain-containing protein [Cuneatibacter caecimuris]|uniref:Helix-turn-helix protein n=1 Tax=Cuneatibacter caecimuris TaxID=1796618 RepID=A0A4Q7PKG1_9FIRM|nr:helix-turn-helix transcriptional regulator [Cuneatibacter caecimuris]RZT01211.1 helix-turn-helix protein [Cuneatibacter caecimuris]